jgi:hypothetical protein
MAKSDPDSNDLRQDQPECVRATHVGLAGRITRRDRYQSGIAYRLPFAAHRPNRGTPNYQGSHQMPSYGGPRVWHPHPSQTAALRDHLGEPRCPLRIPSECPFPLKGVGSYRARTERVRVSPGATAPATFAFHSMGGNYLTPSDYRRYVMRFHACRVHTAWATRPRLSSRVSRGRRAATHSTLARTVGPRGTARRAVPTRELIRLTEYQRLTPRGVRSPAWRRSLR